MSKTIDILEKEIALLTIERNAYKERALALETLYEETRASKESLLEQNIRLLQQKEEVFKELQKLRNYAECLRLDIVALNKEISENRLV